MTGCLDLLTIDRGRSCWACRCHLLTNRHIDLWNFCLLFIFYRWQLAKTSRCRQKWCWWVCCWLRMMQQAVMNYTLPSPFHHWKRRFSYSVSVGLKVEVDWSWPMHVPAKPHVEPWVSEIWVTSLCAHARRRSLGQGIRNMTFQCCVFAVWRNLYQVCQVMILGSVLNPIKSLSFLLF